MMLKQVCSLLPPALVLSLALAGCASLAPAYQAPPLPVALVYPDAGESGEPGVAASGIGWSDYFTDPQLRALIAVALDNNRDLRIAALRIDEARAAYGIERSGLFPAVGLGLDGQRSRVPGDLNLTGQPLVAGQYQAGLSVSAWELDVWGRVRSLQDSALENLLASGQARRAVGVALVAQVADAYLTLRELDERLELASQTVASRGESYRIFKRRYEVGAISRLDLSQVEVLLTQAQTLQEQLEQARATRVHALVQLLGVAQAPAALAAWPSRRIDDAAVLREVAPGLPSNLLAARPDIAAAEHQLRAAQANIGAARAAFFPRISLTGSFGSASSELDGLFDSGSRAWSFIPRLSLPIFDAGRNRASLDLAVVRRDVAVANYEKSVQNAFREVADALSGRRSLARQVAIQQIALAAQVERARLAKLRYDNGAAPYLEVLDAQRDLLALQQSLVQTRRALLSNQVGLYAALGGGAADPYSSSATR